MKATDQPTRQTALAKRASAHEAVSSQTALNGRDRSRLAFAARRLQHQHRNAPRRDHGRGEGLGRIRAAHHDQPLAGERQRLRADVRIGQAARAALIKDRTAARNRAKTLTLAVLKRHNDQRLRQIERQRAAIEAEIETRIKAAPELARRFAILLSIPGIARVSAFTLLIEMPELGAMDAKQAASLAGLAPVARQSGRWTGRAFIRGGRASLRQALYMPALVAMRFNPDLQAKYRQLVDAGKPARAESYHSGSYPDAAK